MQYWLLKSEPSSYSWTKLQQEGVTKWDGVRNYQARNYMSSMSPGDLCLFYHSGNNPTIVGIAEVVSYAYPDNSDPSGKFVAVDIRYHKELLTQVTLKAMAACKELAQMKIFKQSRLSVSPIAIQEWETVMKLQSAPIAVSATS